MKRTREWRIYKRTGTTLMRPYLVGEDLTGVGIHKTLTPEMGGMIAQDVMNPVDQWYVTKEQFRKNYEEEVTTQTRVTGSASRLSTFWVCVIVALSTFVYHVGVSYVPNKQSGLEEKIEVLRLELDYEDLLEERERHDRRKVIAEGTKGANGNTPQCDQGCTTGVHSKDCGRRGNVSRWVPQLRRVDLGDASPGSWASTR